MKNRDEMTSSALRLVTAAIKVKEKEGEEKELDDAGVRKILQTLSKQRKDAIELYQKGNRPELAEKEQKELEIIEQYLPEKVSDEDVETAIAEVINETGAMTMKDMGKVMRLVMKRLKESGNLVDGAEVNVKVKQALTEEEGAREEND